MLQKLGKDRYSFWESQIENKEYRNYFRQKMEIQENIAGSQFINSLNKSAATILREEIQKALDTKGK